jgi:hypothetical protein
MKRKMEPSQRVLQEEGIKDMKKHYLLISRIQTSDHENGWLF